ncbi:MAG: TIGR01459 family HAD-type hydrolase [Alphaproteobacteria bacterium]|nr:TIGR01459 family HAD-type hydrolase [Alphaproteobacteria bacterium]MCB9974873.1 TIGR01459 family HAD-type hydrolase [Rhodospirillales bacterium]
MVNTKFCQGVSDISDSYVGFIIDQWGVLHDGETVYDGVVDCLKELQRRKKYVIILSNSGKRSEVNAERLETLGIPRNLYNSIITSGEVTWQGLYDQNDGYFRDIGKKCILISRGGDRSIVEGLDIEIVEDPKEASFILISGADSPEKTLEDYEPLLRASVRYRLKAICANPDSLGVMGKENIMGPGTLAARYKDFGGVVHYIGKPHQPIFQHCIRVLQQQDIYPGQTVMIGDTMAHDILGGHLVNIDTCLVKRGIHKNVFRNCRSLSEIDKALDVLIRQYNNVRPKYLLDTLVWGKALPDRKHKKRSTKR